MIELINLSDYVDSLAMFQHNRNNIACFLQEHDLDGIEMMFCDDRADPQITSGLIRGCHLRFWPNWIDFWQGNSLELKKEFKTGQAVNQYYGGLTPAVLIENYRNNIRIAIDAGAEYLVFHVSQTRSAETFTWQFSYSDEQVIDATIELVNMFADDIPNHVALLFENLWWPGLTLLRPALVEKLLCGINHNNTGIMLDTGHLMNTNPQLNSQEDGVRYILHTLANLGELSRRVQGIHLHYSLSGSFVNSHRYKQLPELSFEAIMQHIMNIDQHLPFSERCAQLIIDKVQPNYLVHEFVANSLAQWSRCLGIQKQALLLKE